MDVLRYCDYIVVVKLGIECFVETYDSFTL
jgi:hypothetical protein